MKIRYYFILIILSSCINLYTQPETAIKLYDQKNYNEALQEWKKLLDTGAKGEDIYYNIANTYYRLQKYPEAILYYHKALKWNPNCKDCKQNLKLTQKLAGAESFELPEFILSKIYHSILLGLQPMCWFIIGIAFISIFLFVYLFKNDSKLMIVNKAILYLILVIGTISLLLAYHRDQIKHRTDEVILMSPGGLHLSPDTNSESKQELIPGQLLKIKDHLGGWIKVQTKEFDLGWVEKSKVEVVNL